MKQPFKILSLFLVVFLSCSEDKKLTNNHEEQFTSELTELRDYFKIPGLAVSIDKNGENVYRNYFGVADIEQSTELDATTLFPIASITKVFSGVLIMKLVDQHKLSLDDPINKFLPKPILGDSILVKHVLSHTSQGNVGKDFYYSSRFGLLTNVIEKASGTSFAELMQKEILTPLKLKNTFLLRDSTQIKRIATPYILDNGTETGFIDFGYSTSAGLVSNLEDLSTFNAALDGNAIINKATKDVMFSSFKKGLPYGYGIFYQQFNDLNIVWAYGQYDCYSSLLLKIPSENITLTLLANNSLLSDPARLINGDVTSSLLALSFLKNYVLELNEMPLLEQPDAISKPLSSVDFYRKKILAQALAESYMARFDPEKLKTSTKLLNHIFAEYPNYLEYADLNVLHNLSFLKDVAFYMELGEFNEFDEHIEKIGKMLLVKAPNNPYVNSYLGTFYARNGNKEKAKYYFNTIVNAKNFSKNWYTNEAQQWLSENE
ncbi:MAG: class A beta-lactamase-related serine hydrolase [Winogradskyella sp.]|uniref:serine hydrolase domain-containing protein n=1 Tax=Winogradskyella sp. TaxID=1883156 RepID=UPI000F3C4124|nr:serine hydrolase domain-containing protein [Winogradskyella sp.]RNC86370.1 MAG: class A beta-lactamase-related serine hydrolase [Winogradskyella sp.]